MTKNIDVERAMAELPVLREFIDFVNCQVGVYMDALAGFQGNTIRIHRQVARIQKPIQKQRKDGQNTIVYVSVEDPDSPDVIHHRIIRSDDYISANSESGYNEQQNNWSIIVFLFAYWDEDVRPKIAKVRGVKPSQVKVDALGDLRLIRNSLIHNKGFFAEADYKKLTRMQDLFSPEGKIALNHDQMHKLFLHIKKGIAELILLYTGHLPGAPDASDIADIAIQNC